MHSHVVEFHDCALLLAQIALDVVQDGVQVDVVERGAAVAAGDPHAVHAALQRCRVRDLPPPHVLGQHQAHRLRALTQLSAIANAIYIKLLAPGTPRRPLVGKRP